MGKFLQKIRSNGGESFAEIMIAILIVAFGCLLVATMYSAAMNLNLEASEQDDKYYASLSETEQMFEGTPSGDGNVVITDEEENSLSISIDKYGNGSTSAYKRKGH